MHCAACVSRLEKTLGKQPGVYAVSVNLASEEAKLTFDEQQTDIARLTQTIEPFGYKLELPPTPASQSIADSTSQQIPHQHASDNQNAPERLQKNLMTALPIVIFSMAMMFWDFTSKTLGWLPNMSSVVEEFIHHLMPILATYVLVVTGQPYLRGLWMFMRRGAADMNSLVGLGTASAFIYSFVVTAFEDVLSPYLNTQAIYYDVTIVVIGFITLGKYLESRAKQKTGSAIKKLLDLQVKTAMVMRQGHNIEIPIDQVHIGDVVLVKPGMKIPVDGLVQTGSSYLDEAMLTGESVPVHKQPGDQVSAGTLNTTGVFTLTATGVGSATLLAHIINLVQEAQGSKAKVQHMADKISSIFVPVVLGIAVVTLLTWLVVGSQFLTVPETASRAIGAFVSVLVIACPCALGLATPAAIMVGIGQGATHGILIKNAEVLERLRRVTTVIVDKTGTLTEGKPQVLSVSSHTDMQHNQALSLLLSLEEASEHPLAGAIKTYCQAQHIRSQPYSHFANLPGQGVRAQINGQNYFVGGPRLLKTLGLAPVANHPNDIVATTVYLTNETEILFSLAIGDHVKHNAKAAVAKLQSQGLQVIMATGDREDVAQEVAKYLGITEVFAQTLPHEKLATIKALQAQGKIVAMAGDGVNDAPALAQADIGIAMSTGSDIAIETSDITLLNGDITKLSQALSLSRATLTTVKQNLFWAFIYNLIGIPVAAGVFYPVFGWQLSPVFAGFTMAMSSVCVIANSLRLKLKKL